MKNIGRHPILEGSEFDLQYDEETGLAQAVGPIPRTGAAGVKVETKANSAEEAKLLLKRMLEEKGY